MNPAAINRIFTDKEYLFILGVEGTANNSVIEGFYVFIRFISQKSLIDYLLGQLSFIYQNASSTLINPKAVGSKGFVIIKSYENARADKLHIEDCGLLFESVD